MTLLLMMYFSFDPQTKIMNSAVICDLDLLNTLLFLLLEYLIPEIYSYIHLVTVDSVHV